jgi:TatA/E family protein of Tat protein translocase
MFGLPVGPAEIIIVAIIALVVLGPGRLPEAGSALGKSLREFRKAVTDVQDPPEPPRRVDTPMSAPAAAPVPEPPLAARPESDATVPTSAGPENRP